MKEGVSSQELAEYVAKAGNPVEEVRDPAAARAVRKVQRELTPWERELNAPNPYKPAIIRRGRRRLKRRVS